MKIDREIECMMYLNFIELEIVIIVYREFFLCFRVKDSVFCLCLMKFS